MLEQHGHEVLITSRDKEVTLNLLDSYGFPHTVLSSASQTGKLGLLGELFARNWALYKVVKRFKPDVMAAIGGIFVAQVGVAASIPSVVFYDTENAKLQNLLTYPFASLVSVPECYESWVPKCVDKYRGYHELSYLAPDYFEPDRDLAIASGLAPSGETFLVRVVSWNANHDIGEKGWTEEVLKDVVQHLERRGKVILSAESALPSDLVEYRYAGRPEDLHHLMAFCRLYVGESATMASESVVLGVPSIYAAETGRGYCNEQEARYKFLTNVTNIRSDSIIRAIDNMLSVPEDIIEKRRSVLLEESIDVPSHVFDLITKAGKDVVSLRRELKRRD
jgi:predicted glycosyltransferase